MLRFPPALLVAPLLFAPLLFAPTPASAQTPVPEKIITLDVSGADLHAVANLLGRQYNLEILVRDSETPFHPIYVHLKNASLAKALRAIASAAGAQVSLNMDGVYIFAPERTDPPALPATVPAKPPRPFNPVRPFNPAELRWHTIGLQHASPNDILALMHWTKKSNADDQPKLPEGVAQVLARPVNNSLVVRATESGYLTIRNITKILDIAPAIRRVTLDTAFVSASVEDIDALGINFDLRPLSAPPQTFLVFARGATVAQLYQTLTRTRGKVVLAAPVTVGDGSPALITVDKIILTAGATEAVGSDALLPQLTGSLRVHGTLTLMPQIQPDGTVSLSLVPAAGGRPELLFTVPSGRQAVFQAVLLKRRTASRPPPEIPLIGWYSGPLKPVPDTQELLIFVTATLEAPK